MQVFSKEVLKDWHNSVLVLFSNTWDDMTDYYVMPNLLFYFYLFTDLFFFLECSSCPYHMFYLVQCLICTPWTCLCPHLKCNSQYIVFISSFHFYLFTDLFSFLECLSCSHYTSPSVQYLVYAPWTCPFPHCLTHDVLPLSRAVTNSLYNYYYCVYKFLTLHCSLMARRLLTLNFQLLLVAYILVDLILLS